jgi:hypothetical protein
MGMKTETNQPISKSEGVRLATPVWPMLRELIQVKGRPWLEKLIAREHRKLQK